jgi:hypothetical protein
LAAIRAGVEASRIDVLQRLDEDHVPLVVVDLVMRSYKEST